jgi:2'-5' RNA ligase
MPGAEHVVYFALQPTAEAAGAARRVLTETVVGQRPDGREIPPHRLHVSLCGLGSFEGAPPDPFVCTARRAASQVCGRSFRVAFNRVGTWGRGGEQRPIVLWGDEGVIGAEMLHESLHRRLVAAGLRQGPPPGLWPHMTLLWRRAEVPAAFVPPVSWWVREFVLVNSHLGKGRHEVLARFPLG